MRFSDDGQGHEPELESYYNNGSTLRFRSRPMVCLLHLRGGDHADRTRTGSY